MKGQSTLEFITLLMINIVILFLFLVAIQPIEQRIYSERQRVLAREILMTTATEVDAAAIVGDGYERKLAIPELMRDNTNFTLLVSPEIQRLMIVWGENRGVIAVKVLTAKLAGNFTHGPHIIRNVGGTIVIGGA